MKIGWHASHEQFPPRDLLEYAREAERAGFQAAMCSDHLLPIGSDLPMPEHYEALARNMTPERLRETVRVSSDPARHAEWIRGDLELGISELYIHNVGTNQRDFIEVFGREVLPSVLMQEESR